MKIENIKNIEFEFENVTGYKVPSEAIKLFEMKEYQYHIGSDLVYRVKIVFDINAIGEAIPKNIVDEWKIEYGENYYLSVIRRLYSFDDITKLEIESNDGSIAKVRSYWGTFSEDEYNLYQKSYYEVDQNNELTGNFVLEFYTDCFTDNFVDLPNVYKLEKIIDGNFYKYNPLGLEDKDKHVYFDYGLYESARYLFNLGNKARNIFSFEGAIYPAISKQYEPEKHKKMIKDVIEIIFNEWFYKATSLDE